MSVEWMLVLQHRSPFGGLPQRRVLLRLMAWEGRCYMATAVSRETCALSEGSRYTVRRCTLVVKREPSGRPRRKQQKRRAGLNPCYVLWSLVLCGVVPTCFADGDGLYCGW